MRQHACLPHPAPRSPPHDRSPPVPLRQCRRPGSAQQRAGANRLAHPPGARGDSLRRRRRHRQRWPQAGRTPGPATGPGPGGGEQGRCRRHPGHGRRGPRPGRRLHPGPERHQPADPVAPPGQAALRPVQGHRGRGPDDVFAGLCAGHQRPVGHQLAGVAGARQGPARQHPHGHLGHGLGRAHHAGADPGPDRRPLHPHPLQGRGPDRERCGRRPLRGHAGQPLWHDQQPDRTRPPARAGHHRPAARAQPAPGADAGRTGHARGQPDLAVWLHGARRHAPRDRGPAEPGGAACPGRRGRAAHAAQHRQRGPAPQPAGIRRPAAAGKPQQRRHHPAGPHPALGHRRTRPPAVHGHAGFCTTVGA